MKINRLLVGLVITAEMLFCWSVSCFFGRGAERVYCPVGCRPPEKGSLSWPLEGHSCNVALLFVAKILGRRQVLRYLGAVGLRYFFVAGSGSALACWRVRYDTEDNDARCKRVSVRLVL